MTCTSLGVGRFTATKRDAALQPRIRQSFPAVIYCHSSAQDGAEALGLAQLPSAGPICRRLAPATPTSTPSARGQQDGANTARNNPSRTHLHPLAIC